MSHSPTHLFKGACICPRPCCTDHVPIAGKKESRTVCICPDCPREVCGLKLAPAVEMTAEAAK